MCTYICYSKYGPVCCFKHKVINIYFSASHFICMRLEYLSVCVSIPRIYLHIYYSYICFKSYLKHLITINTPHLFYNAIAPHTVSCVLYKAHVTVPVHVHSTYVRQNVCVCICVFIISSCACLEYFNRIITMNK